MPLTLVVLGTVTLLGLALAARLWPADDRGVIEHEHPELAPDHPHLTEGGTHGARQIDRQHAHEFVIDDLHHGWPSARFG